jgi:membrane fusion protein (multidrug efflux system)
VIASLEDMSQLDVDFTLPARYAPWLKPGLAIELQVDGYAQTTFAAQLTAVDSSVDASTRNLLLRAKLLQQDGLLPGMFASLRLTLERSQQLVTVPETAVTYSLQGDTVFVIEDHAEGGLTAVSRIVKVGETRGDRTAILEGVEAGERVATVGQNKLYRGVRVVIDENVAL